MWESRQTSPAASLWLKALDAGMLFRFALQGAIILFETLVLVLETLGEEN